MNLTQGFLKKLSEILFSGFRAEALLWLLLLVSTTSTAVQQAETPDYKVAQNLEDQWLVYSSSYKGYISYFRNEHGIQPALNLYLDMKKYSQYNLLLQVPKKSHLFVQSQFCLTLPIQSNAVFSIDSLQKHHKVNWLLVTLYTPTGHEQIPTASIVYVKRERISTENNKAAISSFYKQNEQPLLRELSHFKNFVTLATILLLAFYTFLLNYHPKAFRRNFSFQAIFSIGVRDESMLIAKPLSQISILFLLAHSMLLSLFYMIAQYYSTSFFVNVLPVELTNSFTDLIIYFIVCVGIAFLLLIAKYFCIYAIGVVFSISNAASAHYFEYLLFSRLFFLVIVLLQFIFISSFPELLMPLIQSLFYGLVIFNIIRMVIISSVLNKITSFRNLYLFSYLCATELIPLIVGIKFLAK